MMGKKKTAKMRGGGKVKKMRGGGMMGKKKTAKMRGGGKVKKMNMGGRTGDMMYSRGYGVDERSRRMPTMLMDRGATGMRGGGKVIKKKRGGALHTKKSMPSNVIGENIKMRPAPKPKLKPNRNFVRPGTGAGGPGGRYSNLGVKKGTGSGGPGGRYSGSGAKLGTGAGGPGGRYSKKPSSVSKDSAIMKAEKARRARAKKDIPTGRSAAASGYSKRKEIGKRKGYKKNPSKPNLGNR